MKNLINYYYNLSVTEFRKIDDSFNFSVENTKYSFVLYEGDVNFLYKIYMILKNNNIYCHELIVNNRNSLVTFYDGKNYILLKKMPCLTKFVTLDDILNYNVLIYKMHEFNWKELWKDKIDYYEYQISQIGLKYKLLKDSLSYYIGLSETAINMLNYINKEKINNYSYICHKRINYREELDTFLDPTNIIIDNRVRDISEYFKINYINENIKIDEIFNYLNDMNFTYDESILFLSRLIYPSYYFDLYDKIIQEKIREEKVMFYIKKNSYYEDFLKKIYNYLRLRYKIPEIEWLAT